MIIDTISLEKTGYFSNLICDYISEKESVRSLYHHFPKIENFELQITEKQRHFTQEHRDILFKSITEQYQNNSISEKTRRNIELLQSPKTFTITTGHQLNLFTGPLYFIYKIISVINMTTILNSKYTDYQFVPVYWMATEDHDFAEINHFYLKEKKIVWDSWQTGSVGTFSTEGLETIAQTLKSFFPNGYQTHKIIQLFEDAYLKNNNLSCATRYLVNELFKDYGLIIIDGNDSTLKKLFVPYMAKDLFENLPQYIVKQTINNIKKQNATYPIQVNPREINMFYLRPNSRERIIKTPDGFGVHNTSIHFSEDELRTELYQFPERFSPNVLLRPVYQEVILPNLCYIGGAGEIAYWLQLKDLFYVLKLPFPILSLRNSAVLVNQKQLKKIKKLSLTPKDFFLKEEILETLIVQKYSKISVDFTSEKKFLKEQFEKLYLIAQQTDYSFYNAVKAQEIKQLKGLENLEKRLIKAQKRKMTDLIHRSQILKNELFPKNSLQERVAHFSEFETYSDINLIEKLISIFDPFDYSFNIILFET